MTYEQFKGTPLYRNLIMEPIVCIDERIELVKDFFEQNIVIPKGKKRHHYADEMHAFLEGIPCEWNYGFGWENAHLYDVSVAWRIKEDKPVYKYKWFVGFIHGISCVTDEYHTEEEIGDAPFRKIEETKRVRQ